MSEPKRTALCDSHIAAGGKMVDFAGWYMPVNYGSQIQEHEAVRTDAGMFDVSHMTIIDVHGDQSKVFLQKLVANDVDRTANSTKMIEVIRFKVGVQLFDRF